MENARWREPAVRQPCDPLPVHAVFLTAPPQRASPEFRDLEAERPQHGTVGRHGVIVEVPADDAREPLPLFGDWLMHPQSQPLLDVLELRPHAVAPAFPRDEELASACFAADEGEAQEAEGLRFAKAALCAPVRCEAAELDQAGLVRMERQRERPQPLAHRVQEAPGVALLLEADDEAVGM